MTYSGDNFIFISPSCFLSLFLYDNNLPRRSVVEIYHEYYCSVIEVDSLINKKKKRASDIDYKRFPIHIENRNKVLPFNKMKNSI